MYQMGLIRLRMVPQELHRRLKSDAAKAGVTLEAWCVRKLGGEGNEGGNRNGDEERENVFENNLTESERVGDISRTGRRRNQGAKSGGANNADIKSEKSGFDPLSIPRVKKGISVFDKDEENSEELEICGFRGRDEINGRWIICGLPAHPERPNKHGNWKNGESYYE